MSWQVDLSKSAQKQLRLLDAGPRQAAIDLMNDLRDLGPVQVPAIKMRGYHDTWRARFHNFYRMVYQVSQTRKRILVIRIKPRNTAYDGLKHPPRKSE